MSSWSAEVGPVFSYKVINYQDTDVYSALFTYLELLPLLLMSDGTVVVGIYFYSVPGLFC